MNPFLLTKVKIYIELQTCESKRSSQNNNFIEYTTKAFNNFIEYTTKAFKSYYSYKNIRDSHLIIIISYLKAVFKLHKHTSAFYNKLKLEVKSLFKKMILNKVIVSFSKNIQKTFMNSLFRFSDWFS